VRRAVALAVSVVLIGCEGRPSSAESGDIADVQKNLDQLAKRLDEERVARALADAEQEAALAELEADTAPDPLAEIRESLDSSAALVGTLQVDVAANVAWIQGEGEPGFRAVEEATARVAAVRSGLEDVAVGLMRSELGVQTLQESLGEDGLPSIQLAGGLRSVVTVDGATNTLALSGNLSVRDGAGETYGVPTGLGNVIVGYDEGPDESKTGSHTLVVGAGHAYTGVGGVVFGQGNTIDGRGSSVLGGRDNTADLSASAVLGGIGNLVDSDGDVVP
jgi:hypothetical protein